MSDKPKPPRSLEAPQSTNAPAVDLGKTDYATEEVEKLLTGAVTIRELGGVTGEKLLEIADLGYSMLMSGKLAEAKTLFTGLIALEPREPYFRTALGCVFMGEENWHRAEEVFNEALRLDPNSTQALVNRGEVRIRLGHLEEAAVDLSAAVALDPDNREPATHRARAIAAYAVQTLEETQQAEEESQGKPPPQTSKPSKPRKKK